MLPSLQKDEIAKLGVLPVLVTLLGKGDTEERYAAMGCLQVMMTSDTWMREVMETASSANKVVLLLLLLLPV